MRACLVIWNWNLLNEENGLRFIRLCCKQILYEIVSYQQYRHRRRMSDVIFCFKKRVKKFQKQYQNHQNTVCQTVNNLSLAKCMSYIAAKCLRFSCHALYIGCIIVLDYTPLRRGLAIPWLRRVARGKPRALARKAAYPAVCFAITV